MLHSWLVRLSDLAGSGRGPIWALAVAIRWSVRRDYLVLARNLRTPLPEVPAYPGLCWRQAGEPEVPDLIAVNPELTEAEVRRRWREGQACIIGYDGGEAVHYRWEASRPALLPYLGIVFRPLPGDVLVTEAFTRRAYRRRGLDSTGSILGLHRAAQRGFSRSLALVASWNAPSLRTSKERTGREVVGTVAYWTVPRRRHVVSGGAMIVGGAMHIARPEEPGPRPDDAPSPAVSSVGVRRAPGTPRVRYRELLVLAGSPEGRTHIVAGLGYWLWPLVWRLAMLHRRTLARRTRVVAVVGSYGKTTTARATAAALGIRVDPRLELNSFLFAARAIFRIRPWTSRAVVEIGIDGPGQMAVYARMLRPDIVIVTSIGSEHSRSLHTIETTRREKAEMLRALTPVGLAVLNDDDPNVRWMGHQHTRARTMTFGFDAACDVRATDVALDWPRGTTFTLRLPEVTRAVRVQLLGRHFVYAALAAVAVARAEGRPLDAAIAAIEALPPTPGRLELVPLDGDVMLVRDEYKSSLETIDAALDVLATIPARRRIVVLGEVSEPPGGQGPIYRRLGARIAAVAARAIFAGGNFQRYAAGATRAGMSREALVDAGWSMTRAIDAVRQDLRPGDVVLIKGRDTQRLDRIALALMGRRVRCGIESCHLRHTRCNDCALLERG